VCSKRSSRRLSGRRPSLATRCASIWRMAGPSWPRSPNLGVRSSIGKRGAVGAAYQ
jgi:hypothetical protein